MFSMRLLKKGNDKMLTDLSEKMWKGSVFIDGTGDKGCVSEIEKINGLTSTTFYHLNIRGGKYWVDFIKANPTLIPYVTFDHELTLDEFAIITGELRKLLIEFDSPWEQNFKRRMVIVWDLPIEPPYFMQNVINRCA